MHIPSFQVRHYYAKHSTLFCTWDPFYGLLTDKSGNFSMLLSFVVQVMKFGFHNKKTTNCWLDYNIQYIVYTNSQCSRTICPFMSLTSVPDKISRALHQLFHVCLWRRKKKKQPTKNPPKDYLASTAVTNACIILFKISAFQELACIYRNSWTCKSGVTSTPTWCTSIHAKQHASFSCITNCIMISPSPLAGDTIRPALHKCWGQSRTDANRPIPTDS